MPTDLTAGQRRALDELPIDPSDSTPYRDRHILAEAEAMGLVMYHQLFDLADRGEAADLRAELARREATGKVQIPIAPVKHYLIFVLTGADANPNNIDSWVPVLLPEGGTVMPWLVGFAFGRLGPEAAARLAYYVGMTPTLPPVKTLDDQE